MEAVRIPDITTEDVESLMEFIRETVQRSGCGGVIVGISGGIDSAVVTKLCVDAIGPANVLNIFMPSGANAETDRRVSKGLCSAWGTEYREVDIQPAVDALIKAVSGDDTPLERGNANARCRMAVLYDTAKRMHRLVMGTCNQSELMMGYFTKFGDGACDVTPLANLYKTEVRQVAGLIGVPQEIIDKPPSAGFWEGQTDESEMGIRYCDLDAVLFGMERGLDDAQVAESTGIPMARVSEIRRQVRSMEHKRTLPGRPDDFRKYRD